MCGIFGFVTSRNEPIDNLSLKRFRQSVDLLRHRGPDGQKDWHDDKCYLGFRHLAFFKQGSSFQPLHNEDNTVHLVCNGEIFNYQELRSQLKKHHFNSVSDCEVIIHLYEEHGEEFINQIKGQFAFILWDRKKERIIVARDRFGICPLYYRNTAGGYFFASEVKTLLKYLPETVSLDIEGIAQTLFFYGPEYPKTCFKEIYQVPPGCYLKLNVATKKLLMKHYWQLQFFDVQAKLGRQEIIDQFNFLLKQAVKRRLHGDFIPGVYASGGLDSSTIAVITSYLEQKTKLFSIQFADQTYDESSYQTIIAQHLKLKLSRILITDQDILNNFIETIWHTECPLSRTAPIPMLLLSKMVRDQGYKCIISGEGADELLAGYPVFQQSKPSITAKFKMGMETLSLFTNAKSLKNLIKRNFKKYQSQLNSEKKKLHNCQIVEIDTKLSKYLLAAQGDRVSMANGIEQRFPFLDEDLVDFVRLLPDYWFMSSGEGKVILREATRNRLPKTIIQRPKKGYLSPDRVVAEAYRDNNSLLRQILSLDKIKEAGYFDVDKVEKLLGLIHNNNFCKNTNTAFVFLVTTQILHELFVNKNSGLL